MSVDLPTEIDGSATDPAKDPWTPLEEQEAKAKAEAIAVATSNIRRVQATLKCQ